MSEYPVPLDAIRAARERLGDAIYHSPCPYSLLLSRLCGCKIYCKLDHLQVTGSFKERGARNKLLLLPAEARRATIPTARCGRGTVKILNRVGKTRDAKTTPSHSNAH